MIDPISIATVAIAALSSSAMKSIVQQVVDMYKQRHKAPQSNFVTVVGPNGSKIRVDPTKPASEDELRKITVVGS